MPDDPIRDALAHPRPIAGAEFRNSLRARLTEEWTTDHHLADSPVAGASRRLRGARWVLATLVAAAAVLGLVALRRDDRVRSIDTTTTPELPAPSADVSSPESDPATTSPAPSACVVPVLSELSTATRYEQPVELDVAEVVPAGSVSATQPDGQLGTVTVGDEPSGRLTYSPPAGFNGVVRFRYTVETPCGDRASSTVEVVVNQVPIAMDDLASTRSGVPVAIDVLANDSAGDPGDALTITSTSSAVGGTARIVDNLIVFTPAPGATAGSFSYTAADEGGQTTSASVHLQIQIGNTTPIARDDLTFDTIAPGDSTRGGVLVNDYDADGDPLTITQARVVTGGGTVEISGNELIFTASATAGGPIEIHYTISDGEETANAAWTLRVNRSPVVRDVSDVDRSPGPTVIAALQNSSDPDGDPISIVDPPRIISGPPGTTITGVNGFGQITVDTQGQAGVVVIDFTVTDGSASATATATLTVLQNNQPFAGDVFVDVAGADGVTIDLSGHISDPDGDALTVAITGVSADGDYTNNGGGSITVRSRSGSRGRNFTVSYQVDDSFGGTASATIHVTVN